MSWVGPQRPSHWVLTNMDKMLTVVSWVVSGALLYGTVKLAQEFPRLAFLLGF
jgi:hypothetical protein